MEYTQLSLFDREYNSIIVTVERPNGTTFEAKLGLRGNEGPRDAVKRYQKTLGDPYGWYTCRGQRIRYIKKDAYLVTGWRYE